MALSKICPISGGDHVLIVIDRYFRGDTYWKLYYCDLCGQEEAREDDDKENKP
jgi:hypothetical protein